MKDGSIEILLPSKRELRQSSREDNYLGIQCISYRSIVAGSSEEFSMNLWYFLEVMEKRREL